MRAMQIVGFKEPLKLGEKPLGALKQGYARVRMGSNGICATDVKMVDGRGFHPELPFVPGHEPAGVVEEVNSDDVNHQALQGRKVVMHPHVACGTCENCITGNENVCLRMQASYGINTDGGLQEVVDIPAKNLVPLPSGLSMDMGALAGGVVGVPLRGIKQLGTLLGKNVLVFGTGGLAFCAIQISRAMGAEVIVAGRREEKLEVARKVGASYTINSVESDLVKELRDITDGKGVHAAIDLAGDHKEVPGLIHSVMRGGKVLIIGYSANGFEAPYNKLALDGISVMGTRSYTRNDLAESVDLISSGKCTPIISQTFGLEETNHALDIVRKGDSVGRILIHPGE